MVRVGEALPPRGRTWSTPLCGGRSSATARKDVADASMQEGRASSSSPYRQRRDGAEEQLRAGGARRGVEARGRWHGEKGDGAETEALEERRTAGFGCFFGTEQF
jgi:hypothetical protein